MLAPWLTDTHSYGLSITLVLPAHESGLNPEQDVTLLHAVRVQTV